jgi:TRAP-type mannitol/chloroaromatic compound transport system permease large subunit
MCRWSRCLASIWSGTALLYTITCQIAYMTPPFGYNLFLMRAMAPPEIKLRHIYASVIPFVAIMLLTLVIVMLYPEIWHCGCLSSSGANFRG